MLGKRKASLILIVLVPLLILCSNINKAESYYYLDSAIVYSALSNHYQSTANFFAMTGLFLETWDYDGTWYYTQARDYMFEAKEYAYDAWLQALYGNYYYSTSMTSDAMNTAYQDYYYKVLTYNNLVSVTQGNDLAGVDAIFNSYMADMNNGWAAALIGLSPYR